MKNSLALVDREAGLASAEIYYAKIMMVGRQLNAETICYTVQLADHSQVVALKAESCLLLPEIGDLVLVSSLLDKQVFILQILSRTVNTKIIDLGNEATLTAKKIKLESTEELVLSAPEVALSGIKGSAIFTHSSLISGWAEMRAQKALVVVHKLERIFHTVTEKLINCYRTLEGVDFTKAGSIRTLVSGRMFIKAENTTLKAEEEVVVDAKQIHLG